MPTPDVRVTRIAPRDLDAATWARLTRDSFFASPGFLDLWRLRGGRPVAWLAELQGAPVALLPGVEFGVGAFARFVSLPDGCYGGVFSDLGPDRAALSHALFDALASRGYAKAHVFDHDGPTQAHDAFALGSAETVITDISDPAWAPPDRKLRSQVRKAEREGIRVERFDWQRHHEGFLALVRGTARHYAVEPRYSRAFYRALAALAERDPRVRWLYCAHDGRPASSHVYFVEGDTMQAWQSHFDRAFSFLKANQSIRFTECRAAARDGVRWFNLGSTPAGADGIAYYKARWGGRRVRVTIRSRTGRLGALVDALRYGRRARGADAGFRLGEELPTT